MLVCIANPVAQQLTRVTVETIDDGLTIGDRYLLQPTKILDNEKPSSTLSDGRRS